MFCLYSRHSAWDASTLPTQNVETQACKGAHEVSTFLQVYGGCGIATLIGFLALCHNSATRARQTPPQGPASREHSISR